MTATLTAVYSGGKFHPTTPPDLPDGATVQLTVVAEPAPPAEQSPQEMYRKLKAIADLPVENPAAPPDVARNHDRYLYGSPGEAK